MVFRCEHFICASFPKLGHRVMKSPGLNSLVSQKQLNWLCSLGHGLNQEARIQAWLPEGLVSISYLRPTRDEYGRGCVWNHTILISSKDYLDMHPPQMFEQYFIKSLDKPVASLEPIKIMT